MHRQDVFERLRGYVDEKLLQSMGFDLTEETPLLELGVLDSLSMVGLLSFVQESLGVSIPEDEILPQHFETLAALTQLVLDVAARTNAGARVETESERWMQSQEAHGIRSVWRSPEGGGELHCLEIDGGDPAWVLVPALGQPSTEWAAMLRTLRGEQTATAIDLVGFGLSRSSRGASDEGSLEDQVDALCRVLELASAPVVVVAHSTGSVVALEATRRRPELVSGLVLIGFGLPDRFEDWRASLAELSSSPARMLARGYRRSPKLGAQLEQVLRESLSSPAHERFMASLTREQLEASLASAPAVPTLLIGAEDDEVVERGWIEAAAKTLADAQIEWIARCGHFAPDERSESVTWFVRDFVRRRLNAR